MPLEVVHVVQEEGTDNIAQFIIDFAHCPAGYRVVGGGFYPGRWNGDGSTGTWDLQATNPYDLDTWRVAVSYGGGGHSPVYYRVFATCVR